MDLLGFDISVYFINLAIAIPVFLSLRWLFRKTIPEDTHLRAILTWFSTIIVTPIIYLGLVVLFVLYSSYYPAREFNKESWLTETTKRYEMTEDLISVPVRSSDLTQSTLKPKSFIFVSWRFADVLVGFTFASL